MVISFLIFEELLYCFYDIFIAVLFSITKIWKEDVFLGG
jgi:hypothetical protein